MNVSRETEAALYAAGWELVDLRASIAGAGSVQWQATIKRRDGSTSMSLTGADESAMIAEMIAHAQAHAARGPR